MKIKHAALSLTIFALFGLGCSRSETENSSVQQDGRNPALSTIALRANGAPGASTSERVSPESLRKAQNEDDRRRFERNENALGGADAGADDARVAEELKRALLRANADTMKVVSAVCRETLCRVVVDIRDKEFEAEKAAINPLVLNYVEWAPWARSIEYVRRGTSDDLGRLYIWRVDRK